MNRYKNIQLVNQELNQNKGKLYQKQTKYPEIPLSENDVYVITDLGDRYDLLAQTYFGDSTLWWIIPVCNPSLPLDSIFIPEGTQLRIPTNIDLVLSNYYNLNE